MSPTRTGELCSQFLFIFMLELHCLTVIVCLQTKLLNEISKMPELGGVQFTLALDGSSKPPTELPWESNAFHREIGRSRWAEKGTFSPTQPVSGPNVWHSYFIPLITLLASWECRVAPVSSFTPSTLAGSEISWLVMLITRKRTDTLIEWLGARGSLKRLFQFKVDPLSRFHGLFELIGSKNALG